MKYYNYGKKVTQEEFDEERQRLLDESFEKLKDPNTHIAFEDLDYYLDELEKLRE
ncbi:protein of unknown function [Tenacibaculum sp. 190524A02b]|uniref:hypothetical protein n=1 Tax=Tenacibaculum vairaonense TaxID=3137860 RepID=UPI0032B210C2